jgi:hypothetical protein
MRFGLLKPQPGWEVLPRRLRSSTWLILAGVPQLRPLQHLEFEHVHLQLEAAVSGLGIALASLPLIEQDIESGRLVCPIREPEWCSQDYLSTYQRELRRGRRGESFSFLDHKEQPCGREHVSVSLTLRIGTEVLIVFGRVNFDEMVKTYDYFLLPNADFPV